MKTTISLKYFSKDVTLTVKGAAVILMVFHHLFFCFPDFIETYQVTSSFIPMDKITLLSSLGNICVPMFAFLSAYGMTVSLAQSHPANLNRFVLKRYRKLAGNILLLYILSIATCFLRPDRISVYFEKNGLLKGIFFMLLDALGISNLVGGAMYNETWWYLSTAILLIFMLPLFVSLYEKFGVCILAVGILFPLLGLPMTTFTNYLLAMFFGVALAKENLLEKLAAKTNRRQRWLLAAACLFGSLFLCLVRLKWGYAYWTDAVFTLIFTIGIFVLNDLQGFRFRILPFFGKHSMNIFLIHTLLFEYYFTDFIYSFHHWFLITLALLIASLAVSLVVEWLKNTLKRGLPV